MAPSDCLPRPHAILPQINFVLPIVCALLSLVVGGASVLLVRRQHKAAARSRAVQASATVSEDEDAARLDVPLVGPAEEGAQESSLGPPAELSFAMRAATVVAQEGGRVLLSGCSASFPAGQLCALLGPSGSGKSVLLHVLRGRNPGQVRRRCPCRC